MNEYEYNNVYLLKPRLHQATCCPATSNMLPGNMLLVAGQHVARPRNMLPGSGVNAA